WLAVTLLLDPLSRAKVISAGHTRISPEVAVPTDNGQTHQTPHTEDAFNSAPPAPTRRQFLVAAGAATAGLATIGGVAHAAASPSGRGKGTGWVNRTLNRMTLEEKVGQLFVYYAYGAHAT